MMKAATEKHKIGSTAALAKHLNLSVWTVSRAINGHPEVNIRTRQHILRAMEELDFQPSFLARGLHGKKTGLIGVGFNGLGSPILSIKIFHLQNLLRQYNLRNILEITTHERESEIRAVKDFRRIQVDGVILIHSCFAADEASGMLAGLPCVQVDPALPQKVSSTALDRGQAMRLLMEHLIALGHRRFGLLSIERENPLRWPALKETALKYNLDPDRIFLHFHSSASQGETVQFGRSAAEEIVRLPRLHRPTALIAANDLVAIGAIHALRSAGVTVPEEMSVTGFDNLDIGRQLHPTLTTIDQNPQVLMARAGELLLEQIVAKTRRFHPRHETVSPQLVLGESTGPALVVSARRRQPRLPPSPHNTSLDSL